MSCNYAVTAYKPTAVSAVLTGNFTAHDELNLLVIKGNNLVVNLVTAEGLKQVTDVNINGRISIAKLVRPKDEVKDSLVFMTARYNLAVVSYDSESGEVVTRAFGNIKDRVGRPTAGEMIGAVDPACTMIVLHLYTGLLKVVPIKLDCNDELKAFNCRLDDLHAIDMKFLSGFGCPSLAYLTQKNGRVLKTVGVSIKEKELMRGPWQTISVESAASMLLPMPLPLGGVIVVGTDTISYYNGTIKVSIDPAYMKQGITNCMGKVDSNRCLLGDDSGKLHMLFVETEENMEAEADAGVSANMSGTRVVNLRVELLGETAAPKCLAYLDNGVVFVGSTYGDSQLVKLYTTADESGSFLRMLEHFNNLGPILDMCVVDLDKQGQDQIISCSGYGKDGSLRIIRSGIGLNEQITIDLTGVKGIWSLHCGGGDCSLDNTLVVSFVGHTMVLRLCGEEVEEVDIEALVSDQQTFHASNVVGGKLVQITSQAVRLIRVEDMELLCTWEPPTHHSICTVACNSFQIMIALGQDVYYLEIGQDDLKLVSMVVLPYQVACVDISPLGGQGDIKAEICAIGFWTELSVSILRLPTLQVMDKQLLGGDTIPRSVLMVMFDDIPYLLCALGDGCVHYYQMQLPAGILSTCKKVVLGTKPIALKQFKSAGSVSVFACSNHPTIIYSGNNKVLFSNVNLKEVNYFCTLNSDGFRDSLALVDCNSLIIGSVDQLHKLHVQTVPLGETPRRIAYQESTGTFAVVSYRTDILKDEMTKEYVPSRDSMSTSLTNMAICPEPLGGPPDPPTRQLAEVEVSTVLLIDQNSFDTIYGLQLLFMEHAVSIASCLLGSTDEQQKAYYVVGTAFVDPNEKEPLHGRLLLLEVTPSKTLRLVAQMMLDGAGYQVVPFNGLVIVTVNNAVSVVKWSEETSKLVQVCSNRDSICALFVKTKGDFILVGDLMRSLKLLLYKHDQNRLEEVALDVNLNPVFLSAIAMIDDENFLGADGRHIFVCQKNSVASVEEDLCYMLQPSRMYIGDNINVFGRGSLVMERPGSMTSHTIGKPIIYGGVHGTIGLVAQLKPDIFSMLMKLQGKMASIIKSVGNIEHEVYRSFTNDHKTMLTEGFIDGDLVEQFLDLPASQMTEICKDLKVTNSQGQESELLVEDVVKVVEDMSRLH